MTAKMHPPEEAHVSALVDLSSLPADQRVAFYGAMLAIAAVDGIFGRDEWDLMFETIHTDGLSEDAKHTIWDYMIDIPVLTDCLDRFSSSSEQVRCALMVYLIEIALADQVLDVSEEAALLQARRSLRISQGQMQAAERYICEVGLSRARPSRYHEAATALKHGASVLMAVSIPATALYFSGTISGASLLEMLSTLAPPSSGLAMVVAAGATILIGTAVLLRGRLLNACNTRKRTRLARERRQRMQLAVRNLQDAVGYLTTKTAQHVPVGLPGDPGNNTSKAFAERLSMLQQMLARRQTTVSAIS